MIFRQPFRQFHEICVMPAYEFVCSHFHAITKYRLFFYNIIRVGAFKHQKHENKTALPTSIFMAGEKESWNNLAKGYAEKHGFGKGSIGYENKIINDFISVRKPMIVIDVGCGTGRHVRYLKSIGFNVIGIDFSEEMLKEARKIGKDEYIMADCNELPLASESIDCCICMGNSIGSFSNPEKALIEMLRVSNAVLLEFRHEYDKSGMLKRRFDNGEYDIRVWSVEEISKMLNEFYQSDIISSFQIIIGQRLGRGYFFYAMIDR